MFRYWSARVANGESPKPLEVSEACGTTIHPARTALRRYKSGIVTTELPPGLTDADRVHWRCSRSGGGDPDQLMLSFEIRPAKDGSPRTLRETVSKPDGLAGAKRRLS
jgi:hypothetical protein